MSVRDRGHTLAALPGLEDGTQDGSQDNRVPGVTVPDKWLWISPFSFLVLDFLILGNGGHLDSPERVQHTLSVAQGQQVLGRSGASR